MDYLPISKINTVVFCERRYYIERVLGETRDNAHLIEGDALHGRARRDGENTWVYSDRLGIVGILDQLLREDGRTVPLEIKKGWLGDHRSDAAQLCAEGLCLREMGHGEVAYGYLYYHATRRRQRVEFGAELVAEVEEVVGRMRALEDARGYPPVTENRNKCRGCSVRDACQPTLRRA